jgi:hypothetical protein
LYSYKENEKRKGKMNDLIKFLNLEISFTDLELCDEYKKKEIILWEDLDN